MAGRGGTRPRRRCRGLAGLQAGTPELTGRPHRAAGRLMEAEVSAVRLVGRVFVSLLVVAVIAAAVYGGGPAIRRLLSSQGFGLFSREPMQPVQLSSLNRYTARVAARPWFRSYFTTMVFDQQRDQTISPSALVTKWERPRVSIRLLNGDGPEVAAYLDRLVARLDRLQHQVRFVVGGAGPPLITVQFLTHDAYVRARGRGQRRQHQDPVLHDLAGTHQSEDRHRRRHAEHPGRSRVHAHPRAHSRHRLQRALLLAVLRATQRDVRGEHFDRVEPERRRRHQAPVLAVDPPGDDSLTGTGLAAALRTLYPVNGAGQRGRVTAPRSTPRRSPCRGPGSR